MPEREAVIAAFLAAHGWGGAKRRAISGDASFRRYERLAEGRRRAILMDAPPEKEDVRPFLRIAGHLLRLGYSAPGISAADEATGLLILEDLGEGIYTRLLAREDKAHEAELYDAAVDLLVDLHRQPVPPEAPPYDRARLMEEANLLVDWYIPRQRGEPPDPDLRASYEAAWDRLLPGLGNIPEALVLRDYHADNLLWLPKRRGLARVGLLDFQDAVVGSIAYDLVSLLEDARRDLRPETVTCSLARYLAARPEIDAEGFTAAYALLGAQRNAKIIGIFTRLCVRDQKPGYLDYLPRVWRHLEHDLAHPALAPIKEWIDREIPPERRERAP
jgi:aminoglycoside/choline kinase family phosphotransferase